MFLAQFPHISGIKSLIRRFDGKLDKQKSMLRTKFVAFHAVGERLTMKSQRPKSEFETFGKAVGEVVLAIIMVSVLLVIGNIILGLN